MWAEGPANLCARYAIAGTGDERARSTAFSSSRVAPNDSLTHLEMDELGQGATHNSECSLTLCAHVGVEIS